MDFLPQMNAFTVFLAIAGVGLVFVLISLLFGEIFEHFDMGLDHDLGHGGPGFFSTRALSVFVTAFGGFGAIAVDRGLSPLAASGVGLASGVVFAGAVYYFGRFLYSQQASSDMRAEDLLGQTGRVVVAIPAGGVGQVRCRLGEELVDKIARADDGQSIMENTSVRVEQVIGELIVVKRS